MGSVGHLFRFLFERVEFVVKGGGGGGGGTTQAATRRQRGGGERERKDYQQDQTNQSSRSYRETRIQAVCRNYAPIYFIIYSAVNTSIFVLTF